MSLSDPAFVILAVLAEEEAHGYRLRSIVHDRGFRFWTDLGRTSIYNALAQLERLGFLEARLESAQGPKRKVYVPTEAGRRALRESARERLTRPEHPRSKIDLGLYALPFLGDEGRPALDEAIAYLRQREDFLAERLAWCRGEGLELPALAFERPLLALRAEITWLRKVRETVEADPTALRVEDWKRYEYLEPPDVEA